MAIELTYENRSALPEAFQNDDVFNEIFTENADGTVTVTGVTGMKTQKDVDSVSEALRKERNDHKETREKLRPWGELDATETLAQLDRIKELEAAAGGKLDDEAINKIVEGRITQRVGPIERNLTTVTEERDAAVAERDALKNQIVTRDRNDTIREEATKIKAHSTAIPDIEMAASVMLEQNEQGEWITKDGINGMTPGLKVDGWLREMQKMRPHWWPETEGSGAGGGGPLGNGAANPFSAKNWNLTEQGKIYRENPVLADQLAKSAGTKVGGPKPAK